MNTKQIEKAWVGTIATMGGVGLLAMTMASCGTADLPRRPKPGAAMLDADAGKQHRSRMEGTRIVSVNGVSDAGKVAHMAAGLTTATVRYNWPQGGAQEVNLKFRARSDRRYFVKYSAFPPNVDQLRGTTALSTMAESIAESAMTPMEESRHPGAALLGIPMMAPAIVLGTVDYWSRVGMDIAGKQKAAQWVDMMVISDKKDEGVVRFVRVFPSGNVEWRAWDACSNAPGHPQQGRALDRPAEGVSDQGNGTFRLQRTLAESVLANERN